MNDELLNKIFLTAETLGKSVKFKFYNELKLVSSENSVAEM